MCTIISSLFQIRQAGRKYLSNLSEVLVPINEEIRVWMLATWSQSPHYSSLTEIKWVYPHNVLGITFCKNERLFSLSCNYCYCVKLGLLLGCLLVFNVYWRVQTNDSSCNVKTHVLSLTGAHFTMILYMACFSVLVDLFTACVMFAVYATWNLGLLPR